MELDFQYIKERVPVDVALSHYGMTLKPAGAKLVGCCPVHQGSNNRQFTVSSDRRSWYCFGDCSKGGSVIDLIAGIEDCSLVDAARLLTERYNL